MGVWCECWSDFDSDVDDANPGADADDQWSPLWESGVDDADIDEDDAEIDDIDADADEHDQWSPL